MTPTEITPLHATNEEPSNEKPRRRRVIRRRADRASANTIPDSIAKNPALLSAIESSLPADYEFEILKTVWRIETSKAPHVALQMPEGLLMYSCTVADILRKFSVAKTISILGDVRHQNVLLRFPDL